MGFYSLTSFVPNGFEFVLSRMDKKILDIDYSNCDDSKKNYLNLFGTWLLEGDFVVNALGCVIK